MHTVDKGSDCEDEDSRSWKSENREFTRGILKRERLGSNMVQDEFDKLNLIERVKCTVYLNIVNELQAEANFTEESWHQCLELWDRFRLMGSATYLENKTLVVPNVQYLLKIECLQSSNLGGDVG